MTYYQRPWDQEKPDEENGCIGGCFLLLVLIVCSILFVVSMRAS